MLIFIFFYDQILFIRGEIASFIDFNLKASIGEEVINRKVKRRKLKR